MATIVRPEISENNPYWIERHRYYELKHFCLQYPFWKKAYSELDGLIKDTYSFDFSKRIHEESPVEKLVERRSYYFNRMEMLEKVAKDTDSVIGNYILKGVTMGVPYNYLKTRLGIPCSKDIYYDLYRRFFWLLDKERA